MRNSIQPVSVPTVMRPPVRFGSEDVLPPAESAKPAPDAMSSDAFTLIPFDPAKAAEPQPEANPPSMPDEGPLFKNNLPPVPPNPRSAPTMGTVLLGGMAGFLGGWLSSGLILLSLIQIGDSQQGRVSIPKVMGTDPAAMAPEEMSKRGEAAKELVNSSLLSTDAVSNHLKKLAAFVKPAVVQVARGEQGMGTGFFCAKDGLIMTNAHVVTDKRSGHVVPELQVTLYNGETLNGRVIGIDEFTDIALVRVDRKDCPTLQFATEKPEVGELVMALGHPEFLGWSQTTGTVSATNRDLGRLGSNLIQTDAALSHGNSGGPLVNMHGEVIGVNNATWRGENQGLSIPAKTAQEVMSQMLFLSGEAIQVPIFPFDFRGQMEHPILPPHARQLPEFPEFIPKTDEKP